MCLANFHLCFLNLLGVLNTFSLKMHLNLYSNYDFKDYSFEVQFCK